MHIDSYTFGTIKIDSKEYTQDLIVFPEKIKPNWWRREGHSLSLEDIEEVINYKPKILIIGTGNSGIMHVPPSTKKALAEAGIEVIEKYTPQAYKIFNEKIKSGEKVVGAFHLTC